MSHRPLIPALLFFVAGILIGRTGLSCYQYLIPPLFFLISFILIISLFIPSLLKLPCYLSIFLFVGILLVLSAKTDSDLLPLAKERERVILEGTVLQPPRITGGMARVEVKAERLFIHGRVTPLREKVVVAIYDHAMDFSPCQRIRFPARLRPFKNFNNPGRYDYELAMGLRNLSCLASVSDGRHIVPMGKGHLDFPLEMMENIRRPVRDLFREKLSPRNQALFMALILGEKQGIDSELRGPFNITGLGHILAVSGLHIGIVAWLSFFLLRWLLSLSYKLTLKTDIRRIAAIMTCFPVLIYTCLAGFQISSQRAMIMVIAYLFSILLGREKEIWSTLALAALLVLALDPNALFGISFQLSFVAVIGILWLAPAIHNMIPINFDRSKKKNIFARIYLYISGLIVITLSAMIFLMPFIAFYFHRISMVSIPANIMAVPILGIWVLPLGLLSSVLLHVSPSLAGLTLEMGAWGLDWMINIIRFLAHFNWASFWVVTPNIFEIILFYGCIFFFFFIRRRLWAKTGLLLVLIIIAADISYWVYKTHHNQHLKVTYLDVGQGNSALIQFPGKERMLIDGGGFRRGNFDVGKMVVAPFLFHSKILHIDYLVLSHPHPDHMNGLKFIASHFKPKEFWYNGEEAGDPTFMELMNIIESKKIKVLCPADLIEGRDIAGVNIEVLHPTTVTRPAGLLYNGMGINDNSLVLKSSYKGKTFLFPGDIEKRGEEAVVSNAGPALKSDVLLVPHHGSRYSCTVTFLQIARPEMCVISSGSGNHSGFPHTETLEKLKEAGSRIMRIDKQGAVQVSVYENRLKIKSFLE
ncbi:DNA internalization-related competence protein ComEC/Rec2 [Thermodesulfobacteriota bacterium]